MTMDYEVKKPDDLSKINPNNIGELLWWSYLLGTSPETLVTIIEDFGNATHVVKSKLPA